MTEKNTEIKIPDGLQKAMGFSRLVSFDEEASRIRLEFNAREDFMHSGGVMQGGFVSGWIDLAMAFTIHLKTNYTVTPLSLDLNVSFLNPALPGKVYAEAWIEKQGRSIGFLEGRLLDESDNVIAKATSTVRLYSIKQ